MLRITTLMNQDVIQIWIRIRIQTKIFYDNNFTEICGWKINVLKKRHLFLLEPRLQERSSIRDTYSETGGPEQQPAQ